MSSSVGRGLQNLDKQKVMSDVQSCDCEVLLDRNGNCAQIWAHEVSDSFYFLRVSSGKGQILQRAETCFLSESLSMCEEADKWRVIKRCCPHSRRGTRDLHDATAGGWPLSKASLQTSTFICLEILLGEVYKLFK